jgi:hypothetical protein
VKLKALKKVWYRNTKKGCMEPLGIGQEFELDVREDAQQIFELISCFAALPIDPEFVPQQAKYCALVQFSYQGLDDRTVNITPQQIVTLERQQAVEFMVKGFCRPIDLNAWRPGELLNPKTEGHGPVKKMFDDIGSEQKPENWATKGVVRK